MGEPEDIDAALAAQYLQTEAARARVAQLRKALEEGEVPADTLAPLEVPDPGPYGQLVGASRDYLERSGRAHLGLEDVLEADDLEFLRIEAQRLEWTVSDAISVGLCGLVGSVAALLSGAIDRAVVDGLGLVEDTELIRRWKRDTQHLPIDYHGAVVGGPAHRVTSAGHDIGRPVAAIRQIVEGQYKGTGWLFGQKVTRTALGTPGGTPFDAVASPALAASLWVRHLVTDVVTPSSLPLPGWTALYEHAPTEELGSFFKDMYWPSSEPARNALPGWNLRTIGITKTVPLVVVEVGVRTKVGWDTWTDRETLRLSERERAKQDEMLLAGNGVVAAVSTGQAVVQCLTTQSPLGLRALNPQVLMRTAQLGMRFAKARRRATVDLPDWEEFAARALATDTEDRLGPYAI